MASKDEGSTMKVRSIAFIVNRLQSVTRCFISPKKEMSAVEQGASRQRRMNGRAEREELERGERRAATRKQRFYMVKHFKILE